MSRNQMISEILKAKFPLITSELIEIRRPFRTQSADESNISDLELETIWTKSGPRFKRDLLKDPNATFLVNLQNNKAIFNQEIGSKLRDYLQNAENFSDTLNDMEDEGVVQLHNELEKASAERSSQRKADKGAKADVTAFFNRGSATADLDTWSKKPSWSADEATALSLGKNPSVVNTSSLADYSCLYGSPFRDSFMERLDAIQRAVRAKQLPEAFTPAKFKAWVKLQRDGVFAEVPADLVSGGKVKTSDGHGNRLHKCYLIILGLAIKHYDYNPLSPLPESQLVAIKALAADLDKVWASINPRTLKTILDDASNLQENVAGVLQDSTDWARDTENKVIKRPGLKKPVRSVQ